MGAILATVVTAAGLFVGTNIDDMVVLAVLNASSRADGRPRAVQIWAGQYAGIGVLVALSLLASAGLTLVPADLVWLLGLLPAGLGVRKLVIAIRARGSAEPPPPAVAKGFPGVMAVTIANGGDNLAAYTPAFHIIGGRDTAITIAVFAAGVALWCLAGSWLVAHHRMTEAVQRWGHWIIPAVYILIGLYVFEKTGLFARLA